MIQSKPPKRQSQAQDPTSHNPNQSSEWQEIKTPSTVVGRRCCHASCFHKGHLYVYGGYDNNSPGIFSDMYVFSFKDATWRSIQQFGETPGQRHSHSAVVYQNLIYMFGGMTNVMSNNNFLHEFDIQLNRWKKKTTINTPLPIDSHKALVYKDKMIVGLGYSQGEYNSKIYSLDFSSLEWKCIFNPKTHKSYEYPKPRAHGSFNLYKNSIYIYGGKDFNTIFDDLWKFDLQTCKFSPVALLNPLSGRFGHSGVVQETKLFIFGGTKGITHQRNDLIFIDLQTGLIRTCWIDSQEQRFRQREEHSPIIKKSRRDSAKKLGFEFYDNETQQIPKSNLSPGKYRNQLKQVNYYNQLYESRKKQCQTLKKSKRNPLLTQIQCVQEGESLNLTSTFEILTNSILLTMGKTSNKEQKGEINFQSLKRVPKARDNYSADLEIGENPRMIIFGGGMHKVSYNDLIIIDLKSVVGRHTVH